MDGLSMLASLASSTAEKSISGALDTAFLRRQNDVNLGFQKDLNEINNQALYKNTITSVNALRAAGINPAALGGAATSGNASGASGSHAQLNSASAIEYANLFATMRIIKAQAKTAEEVANQQHLKRL